MWGLILWTPLNLQRAPLSLSLSLFQSIFSRGALQRLKCCPVTAEGLRRPSPAGNQPSFFHEALSVQERLWISPAASASNTSCYTLGNMTTALPPSSLHLNTPRYLMTRWVKSDLSRLYGLVSQPAARGPRCIDCFIKWHRVHIIVFL